MVGSLTYLRQLATPHHFFKWIILHIFVSLESVPETDRPSGISIGSSGKMLGCKVTIPIVG